MEDAQWFEVHRNGVPLPSAVDLMNLDQADALAASYAAETDSPVCVVRCRRTEVRRYQRQITVTSVDTEAGA